ncbi:hypothetical protein FY534_08260 [Alicyclobacillus sp. TC]|uniref:Regulatory protein RecX n=2 Tax=Alicyclobacillus tolerans TaxID=90970 RepID=A0A1M6RG58_9BACL|nr:MULTISPECIES: RecX family transcriptional regulator [Alicyclobacillus]MDP9728917.1 regulatory protein [Alicyclobacillus tengchongensis]QRF23659.1 hypothetical protein FY534_08260 [Alicyclobacillus sp. TC]SHK31461.1 SOS response regulatory protein OraA/RecX, interacts with RecA [Alicyclobacillus montanus]
MRIEEKESMVVSVRPEDSDLVSILLDDGTALTVAVHIVSDYHLYSGKRLSAEDRARLQEHAAFSKIWKSALRYLRYQMRTVFQTQRYLQEKGYPEEQIQQVLKVLQDRKFLDDRRYASMYAEQHQSQQSRAYIMMKLKQRGIQSGVLDTVCSDWDEEAAAKLLVEKYLRKKSKDHSQDLKRKLIQYLQRKGFSYDIAKRVAFLDNDWDEPII